MGRSYSGLMASESHMPLGQAFGVLDQPLEQ